MKFIIITLIIYILFVRDNSDIRNLIRKNKNKITNRKL